MKNFLTLSILSLTLMAAQVVYAEVDIQAVQEAVKAGLAEKTKITGTLDLYDANIDQVRNLKMLKFNDGVAEETGSFVASVHFRDNATGDLLNLNVTVIREDGELKVSNWSIGAIVQEQQGTDEELANKEYTDADIQEVMKAYLDKQAKFMGYFNVFDQAANTLRNLKLVEFDAKVRKFGVLYISTAKCLDVKTENSVKVDVTVENNAGVLSVKTMKIKK